MLKAPTTLDGVLYQNIVQHLEKLILSKQLKPGDKLQSERELAKSYLVSRTVIREAIKTLQQKGLVQTKQGKGIFITQPRQKMVTDSIFRILSQHQASMEHLVEARELLETAIIRLAAQRVTLAQLDQLSTSIELMDQSVDHLEKFLYHDLQFHNTLAEAAQNPMYLIFTNSILELIQKQRNYMIIHSPESMNRAQQHHRAILQALKQHDEVQAVYAIQGHIRQIHEDIETFKDWNLFDLD